MKYLIVAAHPDDEVLGAGAMIHKAIKSGDEVRICLLSKFSPTRDDDLEKGIYESHHILGIEEVYAYDIPCMQFKDASHHKIVSMIEGSIFDYQPDVLITHHPADIHIDHGITAECCLEAAKLPQRQIVSVAPIKKVMFMEVPSSTDWNVSTANGHFVPNIFFPVSADDVDAKIKAIGVYKDVIRKMPHPRSEEALNALSIMRGSQCGTERAEAFQLAFSLGV